MLPVCVHPSDEALFQEIGGEGVILDLATSSYFGLDGVGVRFWQLLQEDPHVQPACDTLLSEYDVEQEQLHRDLENLITEIVAAGLASAEYRK